MTDPDLDLTVPLTFDPHLHLREIVLVGCGGTGGHLARLLARLLVHAHALHISIPTLRLVDPDSIEEANIGRQLYSPAELGLNKAEATARRLACALGLPVAWAAEPFDPARHMTQTYGTLVIDAVDNHLPRRAIARLKEVVVLACGNERTHGQVSLGNLSAIPDAARWLGQLNTTRAMPHVPTAYALFPALLEPEPTTPLIDPASCAARLAAGEQDVFINDAVALIAARYVQQLLFRQPIQSFLTFVSLDEMLTVKPVPLTVDNLRAYLPQTN